VVDKALSLLSHDIAAKKIKISQHGENFIINADFERLLQVFVNIILNSIEGAPENTEITIKGGNNAVSITNEVDGKILDGRFFEPFYTTKAKGSGLGLAISKKIMDMHGYSISITSVSPFTVHLSFRS
jgi:two-component system sensor histidine kinase HydH